MPDKKPDEGRVAPPLPDYGEALNRAARRIDEAARGLVLDTQKGEESGLRRALDIIREEYEGARKR